MDGRTDGRRDDGKALCFGRLLVVVRYKNTEITGDALHVTVSYCRHGASNSVN